MGWWFGRKSAPADVRACAPAWLTANEPVEGFARSYEAQYEEVYRRNPVGQRSVRLVAGMLGALSIYAIEGDAKAAELVQADGLLEQIAAQLLLHGNSYVQANTGGDDLWQRNAAAHSCSRSAMGPRRPHIRRSLGSRRRNYRSTAIRWRLPTRAAAGGVSCSPVRVCGQCRWRPAVSLRGVARGPARQPRRGQVLHSQRYAIWPVGRTCPPNRMLFNGRLALFNAGGGAACLR
jgi:hypothetical protein